MQLDRLSKKLERISKVSKAGKRVTDLFKTLVNCREIWHEAYARIYKNAGAVTRGITDNTLDGFSEERVETIINRLKQKKYKFTPVRRVYIPKPNGKKRPLGIPSGDDKLVQEVARILLERVYEPIFSRKSHGFRPNKSCHTALEQIQREWRGVKWFCEFDISGFFDNMDHSVMIELLEKRIDDRRFISLIKGMLRAGYLEDWTYHPTYSGTPQGGIVSPILSNIYLHELDCFMEALEQQVTTGKRRRANPEYKRFDWKKHTIRKQIDEVGRKPHLVKALKELDRQMKCLPSVDPNDAGYRRLRYCRYADDFVAGFIGTKVEAREIMERIVTFISEELNLSISEEKTGIRSATDGMLFLSYDIRINQSERIVKTKKAGVHTTARTTAHQIRLEVPEEKVRQFCQKYGYGNWQQMKPLHRPYLVHQSDIEIAHLYNAELRGIANYYALADDVKRKLSKLAYLANYSLFKTLAFKYKCKMSRIITRLKKGSEHMLTYKANGKTKQVVIFKLKHLSQSPHVADVDAIENTQHLTAPKSELVKRLNAHQCEYCKRSDLPVESHHVRKLKDLKNKPNLTKWEKVMIVRNRKTLVLCRECHHLLHAGNLPDQRYRDEI